jgi:hypothetical protein
MKEKIQNINDINAPITNRRERSVLPFRAKDVFRIASPQAVGIAVMKITPFGRAVIRAMQDLISLIFITAGGRAVIRAMQDLKSPIFITAGERSVACGSKNESNRCLKGRTKTHII